MFGFVHPQLQIALNLGSPALLLEEEHCYQFSLLHLMKKKEKEKGHSVINKEIKLIATIPLL